MQKFGHLSRKGQENMAEGCTNGALHASDAGFTLIELMIAMMVVVIGVLGLWGMQLAAINGNYLSRKITEASVTGSDQLEKLMLMTYSEGDLAYDDTIHEPVGYDADGNVVAWKTSPTGDGEYTVQMTISENTPISNVKKIEVDVSYEKAGQARELTYVYYKGYFTSPDAS